MKRFSEFHALRKALTKISSGSVPAIPARRTLRKHTDTEFIKRRAEALGTHLPPQLACLFQAIVLTPSSVVGRDLSSQRAPYSTAGKQCGA